jgi:transposase-like protein
MAKNKTYTPAFKAEVLSHLKDRSIDDVAKQFGVTTQSIRNWRRTTEGGHEQRVPMAGRRSAREIPENAPEFLRAERQLLQGQLEHLDSMIARYSGT